jgi:hypothetical protein
MMTDFKELQKDLRFHERITIFLVSIFGLGVLTLLVVVTTTAMQKMRAYESEDPVLACLRPYRNATPEVAKLAIERCEKLTEDKKM